ncbi:hypothetical protein [Laspinema olomoucense]|uniref:hypothetical protein n=1 Tax=Laspinema olomoucense TaxID=3231600 RepID=UPI0021BBAA83|nr:hypothetical protein [Laspinema sp. D3d]MCT7971888.1 hypothetical protein [Laspinema sp. D3d]
MVNPSTHPDSERFRRTQRQLLRGEVRFDNGEWVGSNGAIALPLELAHLTIRDLSHPYYGAEFTVIGNPW